MPDRRAHRGPHPEDQDLFAPGRLPALRTATAELSWLLTRGYAGPSALALVGNRHQLHQRQRQAIARAACSDQALAERLALRRGLEAVRGQPLLLDGLNVLTTLETALGGGVVLIGRDGCARDIAGVHGTWRRVVETEPALRLAGEALAGLSAGPCTWVLDRPVSNSGRLAACLRRLAQELHLRWEVELAGDADPVLRSRGGLVASSDSAVIARVPWVSLTRAIAERVPGVRWAALAEA